LLRTKKFRTIIYFEFKCKFLLKYVKIVHMHWLLYILNLKFIVDNINLNIKKKIEIKIISFFFFTFITFILE